MNTSESPNQQSLKTCPFCGGAAKLEEWRKSNFVTENGHKCPECWFIGCEKGMECPGFSRALHKTKEQAIAWWSPRAHPEQVAGDVIAEIGQLGDRAYCDYIDAMQKPECLGEEAKIHDGTFTTQDLNAHRSGAELLGWHRAYRNVQRLLLRTAPADGGDVLHHVSAISGMIGYCQSFKAGEVITQAYIDRLNSWYIPNLEKLLAARRQQPAASVGIECAECHSVFKVGPKDIICKDCATKAPAKIYKQNTGDEPVSEWRCEHGVPHKQCGSCYDQKKPPHTGFRCETTEVWQPIETAPIPTENGKDSEPMLVWDGYRCAVSHCTRYKKGSIVWWVDESYGYNEDGEIPHPTHWMPLPKPPVAVAESQK